MKGVEYKGLNSVDGPIVVVKRSENIFYNEIVYIRDRNGDKKTGRVNRCARIIGRSLAECEATLEDIKVAKVLLEILEGN